MVSDSSYNQIVEFKPPFTTNMGASVVIGQPNFTASARTTTQNGFNAPDAAVFDSTGNIWVGDTSYSEIRKAQREAPTK